MLRAGQTLGGSYRLTERLRTDGAADLWSGTDGSNRRVLIEVLSSRLAADPASASRFVQRGRSARRTPHPRVLPVIDEGKTDDGRPFLVCPMPAGRSLRELIEREAPLPPRRVLSLLVPLLEALARAHDQGAIHGNLTPGKIFVTEAPEIDIALADFGLCRPMLAPPDARRPEHVLGRLDYTPPELLQHPGAAPTPRCDVFACGVIVCELLTGQLPLAPLRHDDPALERKLADRVAYFGSGAELPSPTVLLPELPPELGDLVQRATRADPRGRFGDASAMLEATGFVSIQLSITEQEDRAWPGGAASPGTLGSEPALATQVYPGGDAPDDDSFDAEEQDLDERTVTMDAFESSPPPLQDENLETQQVERPWRPSASDAPARHQTIRDEFADPFEEAPPRRDVPAQGRAPSPARARSEGLAGSHPTEPAPDDVDAPQDGQPYEKTMLFDPAEVYDAAEPTVEQDLPAAPTQIFVPSEGEDPGRTGRADRATSPVPPREVPETLETQILRGNNGDFPAAPTQVLDTNQGDFPAPKTQILSPDEPLGLSEARTQLLEPGGPAVGPRAALEETFSAKGGATSPPPGSPALGTSGEPKADTAAASSSAHAWSERDETKADTRSSADTPALRSPSPTLPGPTPPWVQGATPTAEAGHITPSSRSSRLWLVPLLLLGLGALAFALWFFFDR